MILIDAEYLFTVFSFQYLVDLVAGSSHTENHNFFLEKFDGLVLLKTLLAFKAEQLSLQNGVDSVSSHVHGSRQYKGEGDAECEYEHPLRRQPAFGNSSSANDQAKLTVVGQIQGCYE